MRELHPSGFYEAHAASVEVEVDYFWTLAERAGLWVRGTYGSPMSIALDNLCTVESVCDGEGHWMFNAFRLAPKEE